MGTVLRVILHDRAERSMSGTLEYFCLPPRSEMLYTDSEGKECQTKFHGQRTNLDYTDLVTKRDNRTGCPGINKNKGRRDGGK